MTEIMSIYNFYGKIAFTKLFQWSHTQMSANFRRENPNSHQNFTPDKKIFWVAETGKKVSERKTLIFNEN